MKNLIPCTITTFVLLSLGLGLAPQPAFSQTMNGLIQKGGQNCKMKAVDQFNISMSEVSVSLGETFKESIDRGDIDLKDVKKHGLSFNWVVTRDGQKTQGYCNTDGKGNITEFKQ